MTDHRGARAPSFIRTPFRVTLQGNQNNYSIRTRECKARLGLKKHPPLLYWTQATSSTLASSKGMKDMEALT
jgi:hypothetical protein